MTDARRQALVEAVERAERDLSLATRSGQYSYQAAGQAVGDLQRTTAALTEYDRTHKETTDG